ncbi:MAG TPA: NAD(P)H-dependent oxidoreductase subunit E [Anaerolineaceae bacterium]|jgi:NADH:ubiquinone oxidoreductase subunit E|nr:NAD(P)H-dependent oxidoreductase subunit E [Anaerolineales bacterium]HOG57933.1 NAD(P)H-dependent oxidoreductase subunit E [Anaerolineaceae bacterium]HOR83778.1 NAD(P)H-dependent oxidoreductase subunit E [Anaerolineaceae bacterium]HPL42698.1 NAD(P)H-dependent oxidoreductase subunit E [Anaerolineaceae bacterium]HPY32806.1 NAD(P)H-dependent oxidoreductase subunit E [Anaerolineaceae bacterium]
MTLSENTIPANPLENPEQKAVIDAIIDENLHLNGATMVILNQIQERIGFISKPVQAYIAERLRVPISKVHGVVSFYSFFTTSPRGKHTIKFCLGTACYVGGIDQIIEKAKQLLGIEPGNTTPDGMITLEVCRCVGACSQAPVVVVDENIRGRVQPNKFPKIIQDIQTQEGAH